MSTNVQSTSLVAFLATTLSTLAHAGFVIIPSDMSVELDAYPTSQLEPGQAVNLTLGVTNLGPEDVGLIGIESRRFTDEFELISVDPPCTLFVTPEDPGEGSRYFLYWEVANTTNGGALIAVGETRTCGIRIALNQNAPRPYVFIVGIPPYFADLSPYNNSATVDLALAPETPISIPIASRPWQCLLALFLLCAAYIGKSRDTLYRRIALGVSRLANSR
jgi:hypothetical protein